MGVYGGIRETPQDPESVRRLEEKETTRVSKDDTANSNVERRMSKDELAKDPIEGEAVILYLSGDKYVGHVKDGKKHGLGMYVYADLTAYKGQWTEDAMNGDRRHPVPEGERSQQV